MMENSKDRYQQIYQEALKAYPQDKKSIVQREACDLWNIVKGKEKQDKSSTISKDTLAKSTKIISAIIIKDWRILSLSSKASETTKDRAPMFVATKAYVADYAVEVVDDSTTPGSSQENGKNKRDHKKETPAQNKLQTKLE